MLKMLTAVEAQKKTGEALAKAEEMKQNRAERWVETECPTYIHNAANNGETRTDEFKCPKEIATRVKDILEMLGYTVKYREDCELIRILW